MPLLGYHQIDFAGVLIRVRAAHEWNFPRHLDGVSCKTDNISQPSNYDLILLESDRADDYRVAGGLPHIFTVLGIRPN